MHFNVGPPSPHILKAASLNCHLPQDFLFAKWTVDNPSKLNSESSLRGIHSEVSSRRRHLLHLSHWEVS